MKKHSKDWVSSILSFFCVSENAKSSKAGASDHDPVAAMVDAAKHFSGKVRLI